MDIRIEKNMIRLAFPYDKEKVKLCNLLGMKFNKPRRDWYFKNNYMNRECLERIFPGIINADRNPGMNELAVHKYLMDHQGAALRAAARHDRWGIYHDTGCHARGTEILMADGHIKKVEDVATADLLMGETGFREVLELRRGTETMYRITPVNGESFVVNESHILALSRWRRRYVKKADRSMGGGEYEWFATNENISVKNFISKTEAYKHCSKLRRSEVREFASEDISKELIIKPYHLGLFLGDGSVQRTPAIHNQHPEIYVAIQDIARQFGLRIRTQEDSRTAGVSHFLTNGNNGGIKNPLACVFTGLGLRVHCRDKFIPHCYKIAPYDDRLELLAGLMDTDGHLGHSGSYDYVSASKKLATDITFVCRSVGLAVYESKKIINGVTYYRLCISGDINKIPCRRIKKQAAKRRSKKNALVTGFTVKKLKADKYYGFVLDGDHLYLTSDFMVNHNTGKTLTALEIFLHHNVKTLIICPLSLIEGAWLGEIRNPFAAIKESTPELEAIRDKYRSIRASNLWAAKKRSPVAFKKALEKDLCIINYESFRTTDKILSESAYDFEMVILDESARFCSPKSSVSKKIIEFCDDMQYVYLLSGVPAPNSMLDYWTQIRVLDPLMWSKSFYKFRTKYFYPTGHGGYRWEVKSECKRVLIEDIRSVAEYVSKNDVLDLPERTDSLRIFPLSAEERKHYKNIKSKLITILDEGEAITSPSIVTAMIKLRQLSSGFLLDEDKIYNIGNSKINEFNTLIEDIGDKQVVIWINFKYEALQVEVALQKKKLESGILNSTTNEKQKQDYLKAFKSGDLQYIICHPLSVGYGHTLTNCSESINYSSSYSYQNFHQARDRIYRFSQVNKCSYYFLVADKTLDMTILKAVQNKENTSQAVLDHLKREKIACKSM